MLTIVVPTYNRPVELERLVDFIRNCSEHINILILDGSFDSICQKNQSTSKKYTNIEYHKFPSSLHLGLRLMEGLKKVKTPFMAFCGDDDFIFPGAAIECAAFLQSNSDYSAAIGKVWSMTYSSRPIFRNGIALNKDLEFGSRFNQKEFIQRSFFYFAYTYIGSIPLFYSVRRTEQTLKAFSKVTCDMKYSSMEVLTNCLLLIDGKVAKLPNAFGIRDYSSVATRNPEREGASAYIPTVDLDYIKPILISELKDKERISFEKADYVIDSLLKLWSEDNIEHLTEDNSKVINRIKLLSTYLQYLLGGLFPTATARILNIPVEVYKNLLKTYQCSLKNPRPPIE